MRATALVAAALALISCACGEAQPAARPPAQPAAAADPAAGYPAGSPAVVAVAASDLPGQLADLDGRLGRIDLDLASAGVEAGQ